MNVTIIMGNLTDDPRIRRTATGKVVADFTIAVPRMSEGTDFISCIAWEKKAEFAENYMHKGMKFLVKGRIQTGSYEKDGHKHKTFDIVADEIEFCEKKKADETTGQPAKNSDGFMQIPDGLQEEMPFN